MDGTALILTEGLFGTPAGKTAHGLVRGTDRYRIIGLVDHAGAGRDAGELLDGVPRGIPVHASLEEALAAGPKPDWCIVGVASPGGRLPPALRAPLRRAATAGISLVSGLHEFVGDDPEIAAAAARTGARVVDLRRPRPRGEYRFCTGEALALKVPRLAVLGTDCALGKRTTARMVVEACRAGGIAAEMITTGQTGWLQGSRWGLILDATPNDFVSGEIERAVLDCAREASPDLIVIGGQSGLRNPSGPCGIELLLSGGARGVILQHAPGRRFYKDLLGAQAAIPPPDGDLEMIRLCGARTLALALNGEGLSAPQLAAEKERLAERFDLPVALPLEEGAATLLPAIRAFIAAEMARG